MEADGKERQTALGTVNSNFDGLRKAVSGLC